MHPIGVGINDFDDPVGDPAWFLPLTLGARWQVKGSLPILE